MITGEQRQEYLDFFNRTLGFDMPMNAVALVTDLNKQNEPVAVTAFSNFNGFNMEISIAATAEWQATRRYISECARFAFLTHNATRLTNIAKRNNVESLEFSRRLGFEMECSNLKHWFGEADGVQLVMFKDNCKWLRESKT